MPARKPSNPQPIPPDSGAEVGSGAPDPTKCQAGRNPHGLDMARCFVRPTPNCQFGLRFAGGYFCRHPEVERIIARTQAQQ